MPASRAPRHAPRAFSTARHRCQRPRPPWATPTCRPPLYTTAGGIEALDFLARMWKREGNSAPEGRRRGPVARIARSVTRKVGPPCELRAFRRSRKRAFEGNSGRSRLEIHARRQSMAVNGFSKSFFTKEHTECPGDLTLQDRRTAIFLG